MKIKFLTIFFLIMTIIYLGLEYEKNEKIDKYLEKQSEQYNTMYNIIYQHFYDKSHIIFDTTIKTKID